MFTDDKKKVIWDIFYLWKSFVKRPQIALLRCNETAIIPQTVIVKLRILYDHDWQSTLYPEKRKLFFPLHKNVKKYSKTVLFRSIAKTFRSSFALILLSLLCWWETGNGIISFLIVDFHNIHLSSTDIWLFRNRKRSLISFDFEFVWLKTFWNVFQLSSEVVRIISVSPEKFLEFWNLGSAGSSRSPVPMG